METLFPRLSCNQSHLEPQAPLSLADLHLSEHRHTNDTLHIHLLFSSSLFHPRQHKPKLNLRLILCCFNPGWFPWCPRNPQQRSASSFGFLHAVDRQRDSKHENSYFERVLQSCKFIDRVRSRKKTLQTFACLTCFTKLVSRQRFVRTAWRQMQTFDACRWWVLSSRGGYMHCLWIDIRKKASYWSGVCTML